MAAYLPLHPHELAVALEDGDADDVRVEHVEEVADAAAGTRGDEPLRDDPLPIGLTSTADDRLVAVSPAWMVRRARLAS